MVVWRRGQHISETSGHMRRILNEVEQGLLAFEPRPIVTSIRIGAGMHDHHDFEVEVELVPGATLAVRYQSVDEEDRQPDDLESEDGAVAFLVIEAVRDFHAENPYVLAGILHDLRVRVRRRLADWSASGPSATLLDIRLFRTEYGAGIDDLPLEARLRSLDERLQPTILVLNADHLGELEAELAAVQANVSARYAARDALARHGGDGWVDRLVLNALSGHGIVAEVLRGMFEGSAYPICGDLTLFMDEGHLRCHGRSRGEGISWNRDCVILHGRELPASARCSLRGRPVTEVLRHRVTSDDMIIKDVASVSDPSGRRVVIKFEQPSLVFCGASGLFWMPGDRATAWTGDTVH